MNASLMLKSNETRERKQNGICKYQWLIVWVAIAVFSFRVHAVEIISKGSGTNKGVAIRSALRSALEKSVNLQVESKSEEQVSLLENKIYNNAKKYVANYRILESRAAFGLHFVKASVDVSASTLEKDLAAQKILYKMANRPRITVLLEEFADKEELRERTASTACEKVLSERGFRVVTGVFDTRKEYEEADIGMLASQGFTAGADLVVKGSVRVGKPYKTEIYGKTFSGVPVELNGRIVRTTDGTVIAVRSMTVKKNSLDAFSAAQTALRIGGEDLAKALIEDLNTYFHRELYFGTSVGLVLDGFSQKQITNLENRIKEFKFVREMRLSLIEGNRSRYEIQLHGSIHDLRDAILKVNPDLSVASLSSHLLKIVAKKNVATTYIQNVNNLEIETFSIDKILPCRIRFYEKNPLATIVLRAGNNPIKDISLRVFIPDGMSMPAETTITSLDPGNKVSIQAHLILDRAILENAVTRRVLGKVTLTYRENGRQVRRAMTTPVAIFGRNAMDWTLPASLGGFVTPNDPMVQTFAHGTVRPVSSDERFGADMTSAIALFQAMTSAGISYVKDPAPETEGGDIDRINYPRETLESRTGDCDDLSVLYATLLEAVGIETAFLSYSDHVLPMINTGVFEKNRMFVMPDSSLCVTHRGKLWIPVEATMLGSGFAEAWTAAAQEFTRAGVDGRSVAVYSTRELWSEVPPVPLPGEPQKVDAPVIVQDTRKQLDVVHKKNEYQSEKRIKKLESKKNKSEDDKNRLALLYIAKGKYDKAIPIWGKMGKNSVGARSNLACALFLSGDEKKARSIFEQINKKDTSALSSLNYSLMEILTSEDSVATGNALEKMKAAASHLGPGGLTEALGIELGPVADVRGEDKKENGTPKIDRRRLRELIRSRVLSDQKTASSKTKTKTGLVAIGGIRGERADPAETATLFYWFEKL